MQPQSSEVPGEITGGGRALGQQLGKFIVPVLVAAGALAVAVVGALLLGRGDGIDVVNQFVEGTLSGGAQRFVNEQQDAGWLSWLGGSSLFSLVAGMASAVNPCGFAMLPAYLGLYLGSNAAAEAGLSLPRTLLRALVVGAAVSAGFILLFGVVGAAVGLSASFVSAVLPALGLVVGVGLVAAGAWLVGGGKLYTNLAARAANRLGNPNQTNIRSYFTFGLSYGTASLSCTLPIFIAVVGIGVAGSSPATVVGNFFFYALGMGLVILAMTLGMAVFKGAMVAWMRKALPYIQPIAAGFMVLAGTYIVFYWLTVGRDLLF